MTFAAKPNFIGHYSVGEFLFSILANHYKLRAIFHQDRVGAAISSRVADPYFPCLSFEIMEVREITTAFTFDSHFTEHGFELAAFGEND